MLRVLTLLKLFWPGLAPVSWTERLRAAMGAGLGILVTGLLAGLLERSDVPLLVAPMGASAVLLFAVPVSPLAQPWSIIGGNTVSAIIGVTCASLIGDPVVAAAVAASVAIGAMMALRCLHPPSGAVALTAVLGGPAVHGLGYGFVLWPVLVNSLLLLAAALVFNNLTGRRYPHLAVPASNPHQTRDPVLTARLGVTAADISAVLEQSDVVVPVATVDLENILHRAELRAYERRSSGVTCGDIMSRDVRSVHPESGVHEALMAMRQHHIKSLPVLDNNQRIVGIVTQTDILAIDWDLRPHRMQRRRRHYVMVVSDVMSAPVSVATPDMPIAQIAPAMADTGLHHLPVVDAKGKLIGIITKSDLLAAAFALAT